MSLNLDIWPSTNFGDYTDDLADADPPLAGKTTRRSEFLAEMQRAVPWADLVASIESLA